MLTPAISKVILQAYDNGGAIRTETQMVFASPISFYTNIAPLKAWGIFKGTRDENNGRKIIYRLTEKGMEVGRGLGIIRDAISGGVSSDEE